MGGPLKITGIFAGVGIAPIKKLGYLKTANFDDFEIELFLTGL